MAAWVKACKDLYCCTKKFYHGCNILTNQIAQKDTFETVIFILIINLLLQSQALDLSLVYFLSFFSTLHGCIDNYCNFTFVLGVFKILVACHMMACTYTCAA